MIIAAGRTFVQIVLGFSVVGGVACGSPPRMAPVQPAAPTFAVGQPWYDADGARIEAHGGGILTVGERYYWYGENHALGAGNKTGIYAYSSRDLHVWTNEGVVLARDSMPELFRGHGVVERPKVLYNERTRQYVMWMHLDANRYQEAMAGVAVSRSPTGPFRVVRSFRPIAFDYGYSREEATLRERERGNSFRDMGLFQDDDGSAYVLYSSESNASLYIVRLSDDYTDIARPEREGHTWVRAIPNGRREGPAAFKANGKYYLISSGLTGWSPNPGLYHVADHMLGPWVARGNPFTGPDAATSNHSQSTFVLPLPGVCAQCFVYMGDRWDGAALKRSTYVWLPFVVSPAGRIGIEPRTSWRKDDFTRLQREAAAWELVWADEFDRDGRPDSTNWTYERGFVRNEELQWYQPDNATVEHGQLVIEGRREERPNPAYDAAGRDWRTRRPTIAYTSASLTTRGLHAFQYGRYEMRARIDVRPGMWPAFWSVGDTGRWPASGEIDVMEYYNGVVLANVAWADSAGRARWSSVRTPVADLGGAAWASNYHVWRMEWDALAIRLYVDDRLLNTTPLDSTNNAAGNPPNGLRQPHHLILNLAIGGMNGGDPSATTFPAKLEVDYVRVYRAVTGPR